MHGARQRPTHPLLPHPGSGRRRRRDHDARRPEGRRQARRPPAGIHRRAGGAVRLLHQRHDHDRAGPSGPEPGPDRRRHQEGTRREPLPLRYPHPDHQGRQARRREGGDGMSLSLSRRRFAQGVGALVVSFTLNPSRIATAAPEQPIDPKWSADQQKELTPELDGWLRIDEHGTVTLFTGRVEIGNGVITALAQVVAEELSVPFESVSVISGDTDVVPNQGITSASTSIGVSAIVIRQAAATARHAITEAAAEKFGATPEDVTVRDGMVATPDGSQELNLGEIFGGQEFAREVDMSAPTKPVEDYSIVGQSIARTDIPGKLTGAEDAFVENVRVDGMAFARILRGPSFGAKLVSWDESVKDMDGIVDVLPIS